MHRAAAQAAATSARARSTRPSMPPAAAPRAGPRTRVPREASGPGLAPAGRALLLRRGAAARGLGRVVAERQGLEQHHDEPRVERPVRAGAIAVAVAVAAGAG